MRLLLADAVDLVGDRHAPARGPPETRPRSRGHRARPRPSTRPRRAATPATHHPRRVPPDPGELHRLRGEATEPSGPAACRWVCAPDCPEPCLQVVSWLIQSINNLVSQPPIRIGALGFDPGPRAPRQLVQLLRTAPDLPSWDELRIQCLHALEQAGIRRSAAAELFDADWPPAPGPPPIDRIHTHVQRYLCALVSPPAST